MRSQKTNKKIWVSAAISAALALFATSPQMAMAQQWTTSGSHISNTNSGNVGIGTGASSPGAKLEILSSGTARVLLGDGCLNAGVYGAIGLGINAFTGCSNYTLLGNGVNTFVNAPGDYLFFRVGNVDKMTVNNAGVGIGTIQPNLRFHLQAFSGNQYPFMMSTSDWVTGSTGSRLLAGFGTASGNTVSLLQAQTAGANATGNLSLQPFDGNVGIGTASPTSRLHVYESPFNVASDKAGSYFFLDSNNNTGQTINNTHSVISVEGSTNFGYPWTGQIGVKSVVGPNWGAITNARSFYAQGKTRLNFHSITNYSGYYVDSPTVVTNSSITNAYGLYVGLQKTANVFNGYGVYQAGAADINYFSGNVGIGTSGPNHKLDVQGGQINASGGLCIAGDCKNAWSQVGAGSSQWTTSGSNIYYNTGNVGIGTSGSLTRFHVVKPYTTDGGGGTTQPDTVWGVYKSDMQLLLDTGGTRTINRGGGIGFSNGDGFVLGAIKGAATNSTAGQFGGYLGFYTTSWNSGGAVPNGYERMRIDENGNVGIGNSAPAFKLDVAGVIRSSTGGFKFPDGTVQTTAAGSGGGGTIIGVTAGAGLTGGGGSGTVTLDIGAGTGLSLASDSVSVNYGSTAGTAVQGNTSITVSAGNGMSGGGPLTLGAGGTLTLTNADKGSSQSIFKNIANAAGAIQFAAELNNDALRFEGTGGTSVTFDNATKKVVINSSTSSTTSSAPNVSAGQFGQNVGGGDFSFPAKLTIAGNVGIGTAGPGYKLDVQGGQVNASGGLCIAGDCRTAWPQAGGGSPSQWNTNENHISNANTGSVGIGTSTPSSMLDVKGSANSPLRVRDSAGREYFSTSTRGTEPDAVPVVSLASGRLIIDTNGPEGGNDTVLRRAVNSLILNPSENPDFPGGLMVRQVGGSAILWVEQSANGKVGIGTTNPLAKLHVAGDGKITGNLTVDGNIAAKYQDLAEWVPASEQIPTGTVVVLDSTKSNHVIASKQVYDTRVAGVISEKPGIALGERGDDKVLVATTGRVRIKVDATRGPIHIGDLLVTSDISGMAMKSEPVNIGGVQIHRPGTLIGKALEPLATGKGEILVLLSLQ